MVYTHTLSAIAFSVGPLDIRWYGLMYLLGFFIASVWLMSALQHAQLRFSKEKAQDLLFYTFLWGIVGGRVGEFLFYQTDVLLSDPLEVFQMWHGGMSIHGGILGSVGYMLWWCRRQSISFWRVADVFALLLTVGLALGRCANFINAELVGIPTDGSWGVIFPTTDDQPRHPTQLYEVGKNIALLLVLSFLFYRRTAWKYIGLMSAVFLFGYGVLRFTIEFWKEQTTLWGIFGVGQWLCIFMMILGLFLAIRAWNHYDDATHIS